MSETTYPTFQAQLVAHLRHGVGHWITAEASAQWSFAIETEWDRVLLWHSRINPETRRQYSYLEAARVVANNPPSFDRAWLEAFGDDGA